MSAPVAPLSLEDLDHVLAHTRELWREARGSSFFITGGTGFFGLWLLESFARANDTLRLDMRAVVLTRNPAAFARKAPHLAARCDLVFVAGDMGNFAFPPGTFPFVIHAASDTSVPASGADAAAVANAMVDGTRRVLDFAAQADARKLLFTSSGAVYGPQPADLTHVPEESAGRPATGYGFGKQRGEALCLEHGRRHGCEVKLARCFAFVGPHLPLDAHFAIGNFIRDVRRGGPIRVAGDGTPTRSYLYAADLAIWLWTMLFTGPAGRAYNVGSSAGFSIAEVARAVAAETDGPMPVQIMAKPEPGQPRARYVPAVGRAEHELGLRTWIPLDEAIRKTIAWHHGGKAANSL